MTELERRMNEFRILYGAYMTGRGKMATPECDNVLFSDTKILFMSEELTKQGYALVKLEDFVWQPIETVDISETVDILSNGLRYTECYWGRPTYEGKDAKYGWVCDNGYDCDGPVTNRVPNPQHWSRIPRLPQAAIRALTEES